ncbi:helix-turn-helix transcriptional regulator [Vibrio pectenicida]|uniref:Helix-turn-helix transcriptional regulator n=1 Tax=Vibrio pectenicida TaxID=62763 RepID=A0A427U6Z4_9VIBR|nr:helix-turn-helix transcriptional regulator [Vibrio pectenicida]NOH72503.1 helix-turn-helix transcriptional regulator [Vibrio pectenicida]RSD32465.1 XRE family transcriptional regulator [Vibrio pectenicida]
MSTQNRHYSKQTEAALQHFANLLSIARKERKMTIKELTDKLQVSRTTTGKLMSGDPAVGIGLYFEAARILRVDLFDQDPSRLEIKKRSSEKMEKLLPRRVRNQKVKINNDF